MESRFIEWRINLTSGVQVHRVEDKSELSFPSPSIRLGFGLLQFPRVWLRLLPRGLATICGLLDSETVCGRIVF